MAPIEASTPNNGWTEEEERQLLRLLAKKHKIELSTMPDTNSANTSRNGATTTQPAKTMRRGFLLYVFVALVGLAFVGWTVLVYAPQAGTGLLQAKPTTSKEPILSFTQRNRTVDLATLKEGLHSTPTKVKLTPEGIIDWSQYDHILLVHSRKAGGTTLLQWAKRVAKKHNITHSQIEGWTYEPEDWKIDNPANSEHKRVFVFTSLRPPVDRVISNFQFDVLWRANDTHVITIGEFHKQANNLNTGVVNKPVKEDDYVLRGSYQGNLKLEIQYEGGFCLNEKEHVHINYVVRGFLWYCASNYYSKLFGTWPTPDFEPDTLKALARLDEMEIVWQYNLLDDNYVKWLQRRWNATDIRMFHANPSDPRFKLNYTEEEMTLLKTSNQPDQCLYEALRDKWSKYTNMTMI